MIRTILAVSALLAITSSVIAAERLTTLQVGSQTYSNVTITSVSATEIFFIHSRGIGNAKLRNLDPTLQKRFDFDPAKADAQQAEKEKANASYYQSLENTLARKQQSPSQSEAAPPKEEKINLSLDVIDNDLKAKSFLNHFAPKLEVEQWLTEQPDTRRKWVILDFWATRSGPCRLSIPELNKLQARFAKRLVIIGLSNETEQQVRQMQTPKIDYALAMDTQRRTSSEAEVQDIPHVLLIDPFGIVRFEGHPPLLKETNLETLFKNWDIWLTAILLGG
jgi:thiol-disulfide isomerase/thioredoxin